MNRLVIFLSILLSFSAYAEQSIEESRSLIIENHRFIPSEFTVPAGKKIKLQINNKDSTPEEFESHDLNREKIIPAQSSISIYVGPLKPGRYSFFGEFNEKTAQGVLIAE